MRSHQRAQVVMYEVSDAAQRKAIHTHTHTHGRAVVAGIPKRHVGKQRPKHTKPNIFVCAMPFRVAQVSALWISNGQRYEAKVVSFDVSSTRATTRSCGNGDQERMRC